MNQVAESCTATWAATAAPLLMMHVMSTFESRPQESELVKLFRSHTLIASATVVEQQHWPANVLIMLVKGTGPADSLGL